MTRRASTHDMSGPNEISVADADAIPIVLGNYGLPKGRCKLLNSFLSHTEFTRRIDYDARRDPNAPSNLLAMSPGDAHTRRRRIWNRGLSNESLKEYENIIARKVTELVDGLAQRASNKSVDMTSWVNFFT